MATFGLIEYADANPEVRAVYDDIMATRKTDWINNFWKALAHDPAVLRRTWEDTKQLIAPGALDAVTKELIYLAVSVTNGCPYCVAAHTVSARKKGMTDAMFREMMAITGLANSNNRLANGYQIEVDGQLHFQGSTDAAINRRSTNAPTPKPLQQERPERRATGEEPKAKTAVPTSSARRRRLPRTVPPAIADDRHAR